MIFFLLVLGNLLLVDSECGGDLLDVVSSHFLLSIDCTCSSDQVLTSWRIDFANFSAPLFSMFHLCMVVRSGTTDGKNIVKVDVRRMGFTMILIADLSR